MKFYNCYTIMAGQDSFRFNCLDDDQGTRGHIASFRCDATIRRPSGTKRTLGSQSEQRIYGSGLEHDLEKWVPVFRKR